MAVVQKTYAELGDLWGVSKEAARKKVEGLRLPRKPGNDGKTRVTIDLSEVIHHPMRHRPETGGRPDGDHAETDPGDQGETDRSPTPETIALQGQIAALQAHLETWKGIAAKADETAASERLRADAANARVDKLTAELSDLASRFAQSTDDARAREIALQDRLDVIRAEAAARSARPWWRRLAG